MSKCILVTGLGHSGTRLVNRMLARHAAVEAPVEALNHVSEFPALHQFFIDSMDATALHSDAYAIDQDELTFILDSYQTLLSGEANHTLKMPYYPLNCLGAFSDYYQGNIAFVWVDRPIDKIIRSYERRGEDELYFEKDSRELFRQVKKLPRQSRQEHLARRDPPTFFRALAKHADACRERWNGDNPEHAFVEVDIERFATSETHIRSVLDALGLSPVRAAEMLEIVEAERLLDESSLAGMIGGIRERAEAKFEAWAPASLREFLRDRDK
jgi:hypothetical protein